MSSTMRINPTLSGLDNLMNLIEYANPNPVMVRGEQVNAEEPLELIKKVKASKPNKTDSTEVSYNTTVKLTAIATKGLKGELIVRYNRMNLQRQIDAIPGIVSIPNTASEMEVRTLIAKHYQLILRDFHLVDKYKAPGIKVVKTDTLRIAGNVNSYLYLLEPVTITIRWVV